MSIDIGGTALNFALPSRVITSGATVAMQPYDYEIVMNKTIGSTTAVTLPPAPRDNQRVRVSDGKGDFSTYNVTVSGASGENINGLTSLVLVANWQSIEFRFCAATGRWNTQ